MGLRGDTGRRVPFGQAVLVVDIVSVSASPV